MAFPIGSIVIWNDDIGDVPAGWQLADGSNGTVDLRDLWVLAAGPTYPVGATGGQLGISLSHTHGVSALYAPGGGHYHPVDATLGSASGPGAGGIYLAPYNSTHSAEVDHTHAQTTTTFDSGTHTHYLSGATGGAGSGFKRTAYYSQAMYYIQRVS